MTAEHWLFYVIYAVAFCFPIWINSANCKVSALEWAAVHLFIQTFYVTLSTEEKVKKSAYFTLTLSLEQVNALCLCIKWLPPFYSIVILIFGNININKRNSYKLEIKLRYSVCIFIQSRTCSIANNAFPQ